MATKTQIQTAIQEKLTGSAEDLTWDRHEEFLITETDSVLENFYGLKTNDTNASTNVFTEVDANIAYDVATIKDGYPVESSGTIRNNTGLMISGNTSLMTITNTEYEQETGTTRYFTGQSVFTGETISLYLTGNVVKNQDPIGIDDRITFTLTYNTQD